MNVEQIMVNCYYIHAQVNRVISVGIRNDVGLDGRGFGLRFLAGAKYPSLRQSVQTSSEALPVCYSFGTGRSFWRLN